MLGMFFILVGTLLRIVPHIPNVAPISAMALFGGVYLNKKYALIVPLITMFISDIFLGFHSTIAFVYGSFLLTGFIGLWVRKHKGFGTIVLATLFSSSLFFLITNFGVWAVGTMYSKTFTGLMESYIMGLPFFRNTILGDMFYMGVLFGSYELVLFYLKVHILKLSKVKR